MKTDRAKRLSRLGGMLVCACTLLLCGSAAEESTLYEAEDAALLGSNWVLEDADASGGKAVGNFYQKDDGVVFQIHVPKDGVYDLTFTGKGRDRDRIEYVFADGEQLGEIRFAEGAYSEDEIPKAPLSAGLHEISVKTRRENFCLDCLRVTPAEPVSERVYDVPPALSDPDANAETQALYRFLRESYGQYTLSGQHSPGGYHGAEMEAIHAVTGKHPAILSMDIRDYSDSRTVFGAEGNTVEHAIEFHRAGGIVSFCWHWNAPAQTILPGEEGKAWRQGYREQYSFFDIRRVMHGEDPEGKRALDIDIQSVAAQLKRLEEAGVPVLWRPLHEASGGWFWWGADGPDAFKQLWIYLYKTLTEVYRCHNLIWVCTCQDPAWYPGDAYVDIVGYDIYTLPRQYGPQMKNFLELTAYSDTPHIAALTETGVIPDVERGMQSGLCWSWFCGWEYDYIVRDGAYCGDYTEREVLNRVYNSDSVLTLDELGALSSINTTP